MSYEVFPKGGIVFFQGDQADRFFITLKGAVCVKSNFYF